MMYKKILGICSVALLVSSVVLAGCHDQHVVKPKDNPLLTAKPEDAALLIYRARAYAFKHSKTSDDSKYLTCLMHPNKNKGLPRFEKGYEKACERYINAMVTYSHQNSQQFRSVTLADFSSKEVMNRFFTTLEDPLGDEKTFRARLPRELKTAQHSSNH